MCAADRGDLGDPGTAIKLLTKRCDRSPSIDMPSSVLAPARLDGASGAWKDITMARKAGDRYACSECGSTLVYEKDCPCEKDCHCGSESGHAEVCCDKPMDKVPA